MHMPNDSRDNSDDLTEDDWPDESDTDSSDDPEQIPCPHCRKSIAEEAEWCTHCGQYISREDASTPLPPWVILSAILAIILAVMWTVLR